MWPWGPWVQVPLLTPFFFKGILAQMLITREDGKLSRVISTLLNSGVVICPAFTIYGFSAALFDVYANKKISLIKKREQNKPFIVVAEKDFIIASAININKEKLSFLLENGITVVVETGINMPTYASLNGKTAFRDANTPFLKHICKKTPITSTSANVSGKEMGDDIKRIIKIYKGKVGAIVIGKVKGIPSTIVELNKDNVIILRYGYNSEKLKEVM